MAIELNMGCYVIMKERMIFGVIITEAEEDLINSVIDEFIYDDEVFEIESIVELLNIRGYKSSQSFVREIQV